MKRIKRILMCGIVLAIFFALQSVAFAKDADSMQMELSNNEGRTIEDGTYTIKSALNENYVIDVAGGSTANWANVQLLTNNRMNNQKFNVKYLGDGYYKIIAVHSGKSLDVKDARIANCTNVQQCEYTGNDAQKWWIKDAGDGYYNIISKLDNLKTLDVYMAIVGDGANIQVCDLVNNTAQKFKFEKVVEEKPKQTIEDGTYTIKSALNENYVIDVAGGSTANWANVQLLTNNRMNNQKFNVKYLGDGYYKIIAVHSGKSLDVKDARIANCTNVQQCEYTGNDAQKWWIKDAGDGYYNIISKLDNLKTLDVYMAIVGDGANIQVCDLVNNTAQKFKFEKVVEEKPKQTIADGTYEIKSALNENYVIDVAGGSTANWANVQLLTNNRMNNQKFNVKYLGDGYYKIIAVHSGKSLDVKDARIANCTNVQQCEYTGNDAQKWWIKDAGNGYYNIISKLDNIKTLDVYMAQAGNGTNIQICDLVNNTAQKFKFEKVVVDEEKPKQTIADGTYEIKSALNENYVIDVAGGSTANWANVQLLTNNRMNNQKFNVKYLGDGYYKIIAVHSGKSLDVKDARIANCTNVQQCEYTGNDAQKWWIKDAGNGYYNIISKLDNLKTLDVYMAQAGNGVNIQICDLVNNTAQKFKFVLTKEISERTYKFEMKTNSNLVLDYNGDGTTAAVTEKSCKSQMFDIKYVDNDYCQIISVLSNKVVSEENGTVYVLDNTKADSQLWIPENKGNGYYAFKSKASGNYLTQDTTFTTQAYSGKDSQMFRLYDITTGKTGTYGISGLKQSDSNKGSDLKYYKYGAGENVLFTTFEVHGFEDNWSYDGKELTLIANDFYNSLINGRDEYIAKNWTIYIFPNVNPDGLTDGWTNNGPGRRTVYSSAPNNTGIDINRCWQVSGQPYKIYTDNRNYNGKAGFQAYEAVALRDFLIEKKSISGKTMVIDLHGWENSLIGDSEICSYFATRFPSATKKYDSYGVQYLISWARADLGAQAALIELPSWIKSHQQSVNEGLSTKYITSVTNMLKGVPLNNKVATFNMAKRAKALNISETSDEEQYYIELAGMLKNDIPTEDEVNSAKLMPINNEVGVWVEEKSREEFVNRINQITNNNYIIDENGFLKIEEQSEENNKYDNYLEMLLNANKLYAFGISGDFYLRDTVNGEIINNYYEELNEYQTYDYVIYNDKMIINLPKNENSYITNEEIFDSLIYLNNSLGF